MEGEKKRVKLLLVENNHDTMVVFDQFMKDINSLPDSKFEFVIIPSISLPEAKDFFEVNTADAVILSLHQPVTADLDFFTAIKHTFSSSAVIIVSDDLSLSTSVCAAEAGLYDYISRKELSVHRFFQSVIFAIEKYNSGRRSDDFQLIDPLTGIYNKKGLARVTSHVQNAAMRKELGFSLLYLDYDRFRAVNELAGASVGDEALKLVADILLKNFRSSDYVARVGEDEFVVFSTGSPVWAKDAFLTRLDKILLEHKTIQKFPIDVSFSFGYTYKKSDEFTGLDDLISEGQKAMFENRRKRKDSAKNDIISSMPTM